MLDDACDEERWRRKSCTILWFSWVLVMNLDEDVMKIEEQLREFDICCFWSLREKREWFFSVCELWECYEGNYGSREYIESEMGHGFGLDWMNLVNDL